MEVRFGLFTTLIKNIFNNVQKIKSKEMEEYGLKGNHVLCIYNLYNSEKGENMQTLCRLCNEDRAAISRTIKFLMENGFVDYKVYKTKTYKNLFTLTEKGMKLGKKITNKIDEIWEKGAYNILDNDREIFYKTLSQINANLEKINEDYGEKDD